MLRIQKSAVLYFCTELIRNANKGTEQRLYKVLTWLRNQPAQWGCPNKILHVDPGAVTFTIQEKNCVHSFVLTWKQSKGLLAMLVSRCLTFCLLIRTVLSSCWDNAIIHTKTLKISDSTKASLQQCDLRTPAFCAHIGQQADSPCFVTEVFLNNPFLKATLPRFAFKINPSYCSQLQLHAETHLTGFYYIIVSLA